MKVLLINPPFQAFLKNRQSYFPLGLGYLAAALKKHGDDAVIYDSDYDYGKLSDSISDIDTLATYDSYYLGVRDENNPVWQKVKETISEIQPEVVGISSYAPKLPSTLHLVSWIEKQKIPVYVGGPHETTYGTGAGLSIKGEGEVQFVKILHPELGDINFDPLSLIPDRSSLHRIEDYHPNDLGLVMGERGCPFNCSFCQTRGIWGKGCRQRSIDHVISEIEEVNQQFGTKQFYLCDDTFTYNLDRVRQFIERIPKEFEWVCLTRPSTINRNLLNLLRDSNCVRVKLGIETGSPRMLRIIGKTETVEKYERATGILKEYGVPWMAYLMLAIPGETKEDWKMTQDLMEKLRPSWLSASVYTPFPGTALSNREAIDFTNHDWPRYSEQSPYAWSGLSVEEVMERAKWVQDFNNQYAGENPYRKTKYDSKKDI